MASIYIGQFKGYGDNSTYGVFNAYFNYNASGTTLSNMSLSFSKIYGTQYTTNSYYIDSITIGGVGYSCTPTSGSAYYSGDGTGWSNTISGTYTASGTSVYVEVKMHRSGQSAGGQVLGGTVSGLATAPTGLWCNVTGRTETTVSLSGGYSGDGGASVTSTGYQYSTNGSNWSNCGSSLSGLSPNTTYYFRYYAGNVAGTSYSGNSSTTTYAYPYISSAPNFTIGDTYTIGLYNPLGRSCKVNILNSSGGVMTSYTATGTSFGPGWASDTEIATYYANIPNSKSGTYKVQLVCDEVGRDTTINGGTYSIRGNEVPNFGNDNIINVTDTLHTDITGDGSKVIKGHNSLTGVIKPMTSSYSAGLDYYSISASGVVTQTKTYSSSNISFTLNNVTGNTISVTAVDKRTLSSTGSKTITLIDYSNPTLNENIITRQNGTGNYANVYFKGGYTNWSGLSKGNEITGAKYRYKLVGDDTWSEWISLNNITNTNGTWEITETLTPTFVNTNRYDIQLQVTDLLEIVTFTGLQISTANALMWKDLQNKRVGIGKKPDFTFDVDGNGNVTALYINGTKMIWYE